MADTLNLGNAGTLSPEAYAQQQQINRQQQLANMLLQNSQQQPQGQMISGHYVAPSFTQNLVPLANALAGQYLGNKADKQAVDLAMALRGKQAESLQNFIQTSQGTPAKSGGIQGPNGQMTMETTPDMYNADMSLNPAYKQISAVAAQEANPQLAYLKAAQDPYASSALQQVALKKLTEGPKWEKVEKLDSRGNTISGMVDVNSPNPESTFRTIGVGKAAISPAEAARLNFEGIPYAGGGNYTNQTSSNAPVTGGQSAVQGGGQNVSNNSVVAPSINMPGASPKQKQEIANQQAADYATNVKNAKDTFSVVKQIETLLPQGHGSTIGNVIGGAYNFVGAENPKNQADAQLKILGSKLLMQVPRFQGPQSDKDVAVYKEAAGQIGDSTLPASVRMAALQTIKELNSRFAPDLDWGLIKPTPIPKSNNQSSKQPSQNGWGTATVVK